MSAKVYLGRRLPNCVVVTWSLPVPDGGQMIDEVKHYPLHSPDGFEWGYGGSGPADLALAIMLDFFGEEPTDQELRWGRPKAVAVYQDFKWRFVAGLDRDEWTITGTSIEQWLQEPEVVDRLEQHRLRWEGLDDIFEEEDERPDRPM